MSNTIGSLAIALRAWQTYQATLRTHDWTPGNGTEASEWPLTLLDANGGHSVYSPVEGPAEWQFLGAGVARVTLLHLPTGVAYKCPKNRYATQSNRSEPGAYDEWRTRLVSNGIPEHLLPGVAIPEGTAWDVSDDETVLAVTYCERDPHQTVRSVQVPDEPVLPNMDYVVPHDRFSIEAAALVPIPPVDRARVMARLLFEFIDTHTRYSMAMESVPLGARAHQWIDEHIGIPDAHNGNVYLTTDGRVALVDLA